MDSCSSHISIPGRRVHTAYGLSGEQKLDAVLNRRRVLGVGGVFDDSWSERVALEYKTLKFRNDVEGLRQKDFALKELAAGGWRVVSESIEAGHMKGGQACCLATICLPMGFLAKRTPGQIVITLTREEAAAASSPPVANITGTQTARRGIAMQIGYFLGRLLSRLHR